MTYVNYRGEEIGLIVHDVPKKAKQERGAYHNGWRVQGVPPGALEEAREANARVAAMAERAGGKTIKAFDEVHWLMHTKSKPVRSKPFEVPQAAQECKALAERLGWLRVEVIELKSATN